MNYVMHAVGYIKILTYQTTDPILASVLLVQSGLGLVEYGQIF